jgi:UDP-N-acetylglucosamine 2-epimerase (non-hydrolysing)
MKLMLVIGTRPEAIKMAGLVYFLRENKICDWQLCSTGQHQSMLQDALDELDIKPDIELNVMDRASGLTDVTSCILQDMSRVIAEQRPDWLLVQGDTTTAMASALAAYYAKVEVAHVEAGLRTRNRYSPWPEEINRKIIGSLAALHFAPTAISRDNLLAESVPEETVSVTGNTVIDALFATRDRIRRDADLQRRLCAEFPFLESPRRKVLVTGHRRENFGEGFRNICEAIRRIADRDDVEVVFPVHLNPSVRAPVLELLSGRPRIHLIEPVGYLRFVAMMERAHVLLTDSGGIQEEGPSIGKPVLVMRDTSERPEAISSGAVRLVGTDVGDIVGGVTRLLDDPAEHARMSRISLVYGDGKASERIIRRICATA